MAHSAHVTNVRFSFDGSYALSIGGADTALAVWKVDGAKAHAGDSDSPDTDADWLSYLKMENSEHYYFSVYTLSIIWEFVHETSKPRPGCKQSDLLREGKFTA